MSDTTHNLTARIDALTAWVTKTPAEFAAKARLIAVAKRRLEQAERLCFGPSHV